MSTRLASVVFASLFVSSVSSVSSVAAAQEPTNVKTPPPRSITTEIVGSDLHVTVHGVTDYCSTNADTRVIRTSDAIRIVRERPSRVSRCFSTHDKTFVVKDVGAGTYNVSYEQIPLVAPARPLRIVWTTAVVGAS